MATRPSKTSTFLDMASVLSEQGTCSRRKVGVILTNEMDQIVGSGYNGVSYGMPHCTEVKCKAALSESGENLGLCGAIHAEQNALMQCSDVSKIHNVYCTTAPCEHCIKMLMNTGAVNIFCLDVYPNWQRSKELWEGNNDERMWLQRVTFMR